MKDGPDIALLGALIGNPARANMLTALMSGKALTASELAAEAGVTLQTASTHLAKLEHGGLIRQRKQGRHRYFALADDEVGGLLEGMMGLAVRKGHLRARTGPRDPALRKARVCYNHLAGEMGTVLYDRMHAVGALATLGDALDLTESGHAWLGRFDLDAAAFARGRAPLCRACLDWSERRSHLGGRLGRAVLARIESLGWAQREGQSRVIRFTPDGERRFRRLLVD